MKNSIALLALTVGLSAFGLAACETYDAPPTVAMLQPLDGGWTKDTLVELQFSEAIDPSTLGFTIWDAADFDIEGELTAEAVPLLEGCTLASLVCGELGFGLELDEAGQHLGLTVGEQFSSREGLPNILIVDAGLADLAGRVRKVETRMAFQINPAVVGGAVDIKMQSGVVSVTADLSVVVPGVFLRLYADFAVDPDTGEFLAIGSFAELSETLPDGSEMPNNYAQVDGFNLPAGRAAWAVFFGGTIQAKGDGEFFFQSEPTDVQISVLSGAIPVQLDGMVLQGTIAIKAGDDGRDVATGTLSTTGGRFSVGADWREVDPITTSWLGWSFSAEEVPAGLPRSCTPDACAAMSDGGGACVLPEVWDTSGVCQ